MSEGSSHGDVSLNFYCQYLRKYVWVKFRPEMFWYHDAMGLQRRPYSSLFFMCECGERVEKHLNYGVYDPMKVSR